MAHKRIWIWTNPVCDPMGYPINKRGRFTSCLMILSICFSSSISNQLSVLYLRHSCKSPKASLGRCCLGSLLGGGFGWKRFWRISICRWLAKRMSKEGCCGAGDVALLAPGCSALEAILERSCCNLFVASMTFVDSSWTHSGNGLGFCWAFCFTP